MRGSSIENVKGHTIALNKVFFFTVKNIKKLLIKRINFLLILICFVKKKDISIKANLERKYIRAQLFTSTSYCK